MGHGRFTGTDEVDVSGVSLRFQKAVIATGARPTAPPIKGLEESGYLTNESLFSLTELPAKMVIIGAGSADEGFTFPMHHPKATFNEVALSTGAAVYANTAMEWLKHNT